MPRQIAAALALAFLFALALGVGATPRQAQPQPVAVTCTFSNPSYAGDCVEKTTRTAKDKPETACKPILNCLNNPQCARSYCQATTIRQGWTLKKAE